jgi:hypothetical protein
MLFKNPHIQTILPALLMRGVLDYRRESIYSCDDDWIDLDWFNEDQTRLVIYVHGMEGSSNDHYIIRLIKLLTQHNYSALVMNLRSCAPDPSPCKKLYHSGMSEDLDSVLDWVLNHYQYKEIFLIGFSIGANIVLKYIGEKQINKKISKAIAVSVPLDLASSAKALDMVPGQFYTRYLMKKLGRKLNKDLSHIRSFYEYDQNYTAPMHGFVDNFDYWQKSSSKQFLEKINIPTLIINSLDDPFLGPECFPSQEQNNNTNLRLITPDFGGHLGFMELSLDMSRGLKINFSHEKYILEFL